MNFSLEAYWSECIWARLGGHRSHELRFQVSLIRTLGHGVCFSMAPSTCSCFYSGIDKKPNSFHLKKGSVHRISNNNPVLVTLVSKSLVLAKSIFRKKCSETLHGFLTKSLLLSLISWTWTLRADGLFVEIVVVIIIIGPLLQLWCSIQYSGHIIIICWKQCSGQQLFFFPPSHPPKTTRSIQLPVDDAHDHNSYPCTSACFPGGKNTFLGSWELSLLDFLSGSPSTTSFESSIQENQFLIALFFFYSLHFLRLNDGDQNDLN